jgi:hypothetical protein
MDDTPPEEDGGAVLLDHVVLGAHRRHHLVGEVDLPGAAQARCPALLGLMARDAAAAARHVFWEVDLLRPEDRELVRARQLDEPQEVRDDRALVRSADTGLLHPALRVAEALLHVDHEQRGHPRVDVRLGRAHALSPFSRDSADAPASTELLMSSSTLWRWLRTAARAPAASPAQTAR